MALRGVVGQGPSPSETIAPAGAKKHAPFANSPNSPKQPAQQQVTAQNHEILPSSKGAIHLSNDDL